MSHSPDNPIYKVGDCVVIKKAGTKNGYWHWIEPMDKLIGMTGIVVPSDKQADETEEEIEHPYYVVTTFREEDVPLGTGYAYHKDALRSASPEEARIITLLKNVHGMHI